MHSVFRTTLFSFFLMTGLAGPLFAQYSGLQKLSTLGNAISEVVAYTPTLTRLIELENPQAEYMKGIGQHLVVNSNGLFVFPDGTGRLYRIEVDEGGLKSIRLDSTVYFGYNFGFLPFSYRDTLYSFGGYGFWRYNGHLRYFVPGKGEWELKSLNREIPFHRYAYHAAPKWLDQRNGKFWIGYTISKNEVIQENDGDLNDVADSVYVLDLLSRRWSTIGKLSLPAKEIASAIASKNLGSTPWGQLLEDPLDNIYLMDYTHNQLMRLDDRIAEKIVALLQPESLLYCYDSTLFIGLQSTLPDSIALERINFQPTGNPVYIAEGSTNLIAEATSDPFVWIVTSAVSLIILMILVFRNQSSLRNRKGGKTDVRIFDEKEEHVLNLIIANSRKGNGVSIDDMNRILGVSQKNIDVQKKQRSDVLSSINKKWSLKNNTKEPLIRKRRLEEDKRSYEYYVRFEDMDAGGNR